VPAIPTGKTGSATETKRSQLVSKGLETDGGDLCLDTIGPKIANASKRNGLLRARCKRPRCENNGLDELAPSHCLPTPRRFGIVAAHTSRLEVVGCYQAAVLAELAGTVYSVEIIEELAQRAIG
jgi:hypothetical protein